MDRPAASVRVTSDPSPVEVPESCARVPVMAPVFTVLKVRDPTATSAACRYWVVAVGSATITCHGESCTEAPGQASSVVKSYLAGGDSWLGLNCW
ncbi:MAG: hypothetical protein ACYC6C_12965 [Coriobacteriia bacterium]